MLRKFVLVLFMVLPVLSFANQPNLDDILVQNNQRVGKVEFKKWFFHVYNAELFTKDGGFSWEKPFVLKIHYMISFKSKAIIDMSISEIEKQHPNISEKDKKAFLEILKKAIPDAKKNHNLYGYMDKNGYAYIFSDSKLEGKIDNKKLSKYFFEIWLSDSASNYKLSKELRGLYEKK